MLEDPFSAPEIHPFVQLLLGRTSIMVTRRLATFPDVQLLSTHLCSARVITTSIGICLVIFTSSLRVSRRPVVGVSKKIMLYAAGPVVGAYPKFVGEAVYGSAHDYCEIISSNEADFFESCLSMDIAVAINA